MSDCTNGDYTKSGYTKTGKKVKCINSERVDLTYNKVYDVFIDKSGDEFLIDEAGDKRYECLEFPLWREVFDDATNEQKPKLKVGDKVKVVDTTDITVYTKNLKVGDIGVIVGISKGHGAFFYDVKFDGCAKQESWWFTDKCIELVSDNTNNIENENTQIKSDGNQIVSDGGSSSYYAQQIPKGMLERFNETGIIEAKDVIRLFLNNDFTFGNIFKAYCRVISLRNGKGKAGIDEKYDLTKASFFADEELKNYLENNQNNA